MSSSVSASFVSSSSKGNTPPPPSRSNSRHLNHHHGASLDKADSAPRLAHLTAVLGHHQDLNAPTSILVRARVWEVLAPPPVTSLKGVLVPQAFSTRRRRRKISIEVHRIDAKHRRGSYEECIVRVLNPASKEETNASLDKRKQMRASVAVATNQKMRASVAVAAASFSSTPAGASSRTKTHNKYKNHNNNNNDEQQQPEEEEEEEEEDDDDFNDDESTSAGAHDRDRVDPSLVNFAVPKDQFVGWDEKYRFALHNMVIKGTIRTGVFVQVTLGRVAQRRQLIFDTMQEAEDFREMVAQEMALEKLRNEQKLKVVFFGRPPPPLTELTFLIEIVSGWDLPIGDISTSDPYVICTFNGKDIHATQPISRTLDPIWTVKEGSLFLLKVGVQALFLSEGLLFSVYDYDAVGTHEALGCFIVSPSVVYDAKGERMEYKLFPMGGYKKKQVSGYIALRIRKATKHDIEFMQQHIYKDLRKAGFTLMEKATDQSGGVNILKSYFSRQARTIIAQNGQEIKQYKIRPGPDPQREEETTWMTNEQIQQETKQESQHWVDIGSGSLGRLHVEVLGCDGLPNLDTGGRNKTDTFVALVYEDAFVKTDVIDDCLNPRWLPWTKRATIFHIHHSSSALYLGVFDYDQGSDHDLVGRVSVDLTNLHRDTMYVLKYDIYTTSRLSDRKCKGSVTLRLRLEYEDDRALLLSNLEPPPEFFVNTKTRKDFRVLTYTCTGKYDTSQYDIKYINSYIEEILTMQNSLYYVKDALLHLVLWRGTYPLRFWGKTFSIPVHSFAAFASLVLVVERPQLLPSWCLAVMGWIMLAMMDYRLHSPDPWLRCKDFGDFCSTLVLGYSPNPQQSIKPYENAEEAKAYLEKMKKKIEAAEAAAAAAYKEQTEAQEELEQEMNEIGDTSTDISTNRGGGGFSMGPFKAILFPLQQNLAMITRYLRHAHWILYWEECYISFWFTAGCFLLSIVCLFVPWFFLIKWTSRILVWMLLGPWMKLVDIFYVRKLENQSEEEQDQLVMAAREKRRLAAAEAIKEARIQREKAVKLKAMKIYMFGKFISRVPVMKEDRFKDIPLPASYAIPYTPDPLPLSEIAMQEAGYHRTRLPGQHLVGDMIPRMQTVGFTDAPIGQPIKQRKLVDKQSPAGILGSGPESTTMAYIKIGSLVFTSLVISWFAVPFFSGFIDRLLLSIQKQLE